MLDFLNDLKMSPNSSFCFGDKNFNALDELGSSPFNYKPISQLETQDHLEDPFVSEKNNDLKLELKKTKKRRGNKKDDFDYNKFIERELKKSDTSKLDSN